MTAIPLPFAGLSCYTSNLAGYLAAEFSDYERRFADTVCLSIRIDLPDGELAFRHHRAALNLLPDDSCLDYGTADDVLQALVGVRTELDAYGRCLVVVDNARLPWSPAYRHGTSAPHWLLVDGVVAGGWHVVDAFCGLLPHGEQLPYQGELSSAGLAAAMQPPSRWRPEQRRRNELAFGWPVPPPNPTGPQWLRRRPVATPALGLTGTWLSRDEDVLPFLADYLAAEGARAERYLDDLWAAARHRAFAHRLSGNDAAEAAWQRLPGALRFAVDSAGRGRPRSSLIRATLAHLLDLENAPATKARGGRTADEDSNAL